MNNNVNEKVKTSEKFRMTFIVILLLLIIVPVGFICYDKFFNIEKPPVPTPIPTNDIVVDKINSLSRIDVNETDQVVNVDGKEYKIKREITVDGAFLLIDDSVIEVAGETTVYADNAYVTDKFIIFTMAAQDGEMISYIMDKEGNEVTYNDNEYQMHDFILVDGVLHASGHVFCGLDGDCPDKDLIIKYNNNEIIVSPNN